MQDWSELWTLALGLFAGAAAPWPLKALWRWIRREAAAETEISREQHIALLRKALDRAGIRTSGALSACDLLIVATELIREATGELPPAARHAVGQARQKLAHTVQALDRISGGEDA